jgi:hypothetical protein
VIDLAGPSIEQRREAALAELRALVAQLDCVHDEQTEVSFAHWASQHWAGWVMVLVTALACALTLLAAVVWSVTAAYALATAETVGALVLRTRRVSHPWWRRWLYGVLIAVLVITIS